MKFFKNKAQFYWILAFVWVACIYATLSIVRTVCEYLREAIPFSLAIYGLIVSLIFSGLIYIFWRYRRVHLSTLILFSGIFGLYLLGLNIITIPEEKVHFVQYGVLAFFIYKASKESFPRLTAYVISFVLTSFFGVIDECIQHFLPTRFFGWKDIYLNAASAALALGLVFSLEREIRLQR